MQYNEKKKQNLYNFGQSYDYDIVNILHAASKMACNFEITYFMQRATVCTYNVCMYFVWPPKSLLQYLEGTLRELFSSTCVIVTYVLIPSLVYLDRRIWYMCIGSYIFDLSLIFCRTHIIKVNS